MEQEPNFLPQDERTIKELDKLFEDIQNVGKEFAGFKLGEVYLEEEWDEWDPKKVWVNTNSMGFPIKYKVVHISKQGIPFLKQLNTNGKPTGRARLPVSDKSVWLTNIVHAVHYGAVKQTSRFILDPDALDSILLEHEYHPMAEQKDKLRLFNEINKHNKKVAIKTSWSAGQQHIANFFKSLKPGDKFWTSPDKGYVFHRLEKAGNAYKIVTVDQNNAEKIFEGFNYFMHKRLYSAQPRSFSKESAT